MVNSRRHAYAIALAVGLASCGGLDRNGEPVISTVPAQSTDGGIVFSLDLEPFVVDPEGNALTYSVISGGGSFAGSVYSHTFDTIGEYTVEFLVADQNKASASSFDVSVKTANLAVIQQNDDLQLLDTDTQKFRPVTGALGFMDTHVGTLSTGHLVYERSAGTMALFVYDPSTMQTFTLGDDNTENTRFAAVTSDLHVLYTTAAVATPLDTDLHIWSAETGLSRDISATPGQPDGNAFPTTIGLVYYERSVPSDIYVYNTANDTSAAVATDANAEVIRGVLPNQGIAFTRVGPGGELDLFYHQVLAGVVEVGLDLSPTAQGQNKTYRGATSDSKIVFEVADVASIDLYIWDPATATTTLIAGGAFDETFAAVTALDEVVFNIATSPTNNDLSIYTHGGAPAVRSISADASNDIHQGGLSNGDVVILREAGTGDELHLFDTSGNSLNALATAGTDNYVFNVVLEGDKVAYTREGASGGVFVVNTTGAPVPTLVGGPGSRFGGETSGGDFVVEALVTAQFDLVLWDESAGGTVTISSAMGDDTFGAGASNGDVVFQRVVMGKSNADLFQWNPGTGMSTQLTDTTIDHAVVTTYRADTN